MDAVAGRVGLSDSNHYSSAPPLQYSKRCPACSDAIECNEALATRKLPRLSVFQNELVRCLRIEKPFDADRSNSRFHHAEGPCRCSGNVNDTTFGKGAPIINEHFNGFPVG